jgi:hypothetical protein
MNLPTIGQEVSVPELLLLAAAYEKIDIVKVLQDCPPATPFVSDGCSMWPDSWLGKDIYPACFWHDVRYWCGVRGDDVARLCADAELAKDVAAIAGADLARAMFVGVGFGGTEDFRTPFRWGYGR